MITRIWSAITGARTLITVGVAAFALGAAPAYLAGRTHAADKAEAAKAASMTAALFGERELAQRREQTLGRWAIEGMRIAQIRADETRTESTRLNTLGDQARDTASDPLRADWPLSDQRRLACVLDPECDPAADRDPGAATP